MCASINLIVARSLLLLFYQTTLTRDRSEPRPHQPRPHWPGPHRHTFIRKTTTMKSSEASRSFPWHIDTCIIDRLCSQNKKLKYRLRIWRCRLWTRQWPKPVAQGYIHVWCSRCRLCSHFLKYLHPWWLTSTWQLSHLTLASQLIINTSTLVLPLNNNTRARKMIHINKALA